MSLNWKDKLADHIPANWGQEIDSFEAQIALRKSQKIEEKVFAETRLRRGSYGQRYDNGQRHDGVKTQKLTYPPLTKGPRVRPAAIATDPANAAPAPSCAGWSSRMAAARQAITIPAPTP